MALPEKFARGEVFNFKKWGSGEVCCLTNFRPLGNALSMRVSGFLICVLSLTQLASPRESRSGKWGSLVGKSGDKALFGNASYRYLPSSAADTIVPLVRVVRQTCLCTSRGSIRYRVILLPATAIPPRDHTAAPPRRHAHPAYMPPAKRTTDTMDRTTPRPP